jgi:hypothetical protein
MPVTPIGWTGIAPAGDPRIKELAGEIAQSRLDMERFDEMYRHMLALATKDALAPQVTPASEDGITVEGGDDWSPADVSPLHYPPADAVYRPGWWDILQLYWIWAPEWVKVLLALVIWFTLFVIGYALMAQTLPMSTVRV